MNTPLSRLRRLPPALFALTRFGQGDNANARRRSGHGVRWDGGLRRHLCGGVRRAVGLSPMDLVRNGAACSAVELAAVACNMLPNSQLSAQVALGPQADFIQICCSTEGACGAF